MDYYELFFTILVSIFVVMTIITLIWHINYKKSVKSTRCYKPASSENKISIVAKNKYGDSMYKVKYDLKKRRQHIKCACEGGNVQNSFDVKYFDINHYKDKTQRIACSCSESFDLISQLNTYYYGEPGLVRYMETDEKEVFDPAYEEKD